MREAMWVMKVEEQEKEMSAAEAAGVHQSTVLKAQERALQERQLELDAARAEMAANVRLSALSLTACFSSITSSHLGVGNAALCFVRHSHTRKCLCPCAD